MKEGEEEKEGKGRFEAEEARKVVKRQSIFPARTEVEPGGRPRLVVIGQEGTAGCASHACPFAGLSSPHLLRQSARGNLQIANPSPPRPSPSPMND